MEYHEESQAQHKCWRTSTESYWDKTWCGWVYDLWDNSVEIFRRTRKKTVPCRKFSFWNLLVNGQHCHWSQKAWNSCQICVMSAGELWIALHCDVTYFQKSRDISQVVSGAIHAVTDVQRQQDNESLGFLLFHYLFLRELSNNAAV